MTRRAPEKSEPLKWEPPGGHALAGETSLDAALREVREETGIVLSPEDGRRAFALRRREICWENPGFLDVWVFEGDWPLEDLTLQPGEVCAARWATEQEIVQMIESGEFVPTEAHPYYRELFAGA